MSVEEDPPTLARRALPVLQARTDQHFERALQRSGGQMRCAPGCDQCCHVRFSVFTVEAEGIRAALLALETSDPLRRARVRQQADDPAGGDRCPMLVEHQCAVYEARPIICRSHGTPVLIEDPGEPPRQECCPLNFREAPPDPLSVLRLEAINQPLTVMARMFDGGGARVSLTELARESEGPNPLG